MCVQQENSIPEPQDLGVCKDGRREGGWENNVSAPTLSSSKSSYRTAISHQTVAWATCEKHGRF